MWVNVRRLFYLHVHMSNRIAYLYNMRLTTHIPTYEYTCECIKTTLVKYNIDESHERKLSNTMVSVSKGLKMAVCPTYSTYKVGNQNPFCFRGNFLLNPRFCIRNFPRNQINKHQIVIRGENNMKSTQIISGPGNICVNRRFQTTDVVLSMRIMQKISTYLFSLGCSPVHVHLFEMVFIPFNVQKNRRKIFSKWIGLQLTYL